MRRLLAFSLVVGCSALVNPDPSQLGDPVVSTECPTDCNDGVECTRDRCEAGVCVNERDNTACAESERCDMVMGCVDASCTSSAECDDGLACNGLEVCNAGRCEEGDAVVCDDSIDCTVDRCDEATGACVSEASDERCDDGVPCTMDSCGDTGCVNEPNDGLCDDGFCFEGASCTADGCQGGMERDCRDGDECTVDTCDPDAMMCLNEVVDGDMDSFSPVAACGEVDCNDMDPSIFPGAPEICDDIDQDCDGDITDGCEPMIPDTCDTAQLLAAPGDAEISVSGTFSTYSEDYDQECVESDGADAVFVLNIQANRDYIIDTVGSRADTILAVTQECGSWNFAGRGCNDDIVTSVNRQSRLFLRRLGDAPGLTQVFILLKKYSRDDAADDWTLNVRPAEASGLACNQRFDISEGGAVVGYISPMASQLTFNGCQNNGFGKREHFFRVRTTDDNGEVDVRSWSDDFRHSIVHSRGCVAPGQECDEANAGSRAQIDWTPSRADGLVVIDGADSAEGDFYTLRYQPR